LWVQCVNNMGSSPRKPGRPRKTEGMSEYFKFRLSGTHKKLIEDAAAHAIERRGTGNVSDWLREILVRAARKELGESGEEGD